MEAMEAAYKAVAKEDLSVDWTLPETVWVESSGSRLLKQICLSMRHKQTPPLDT